MQNKRYYTSQYLIILIISVATVVFLLTNLLYTIGFNKINSQQNITLDISGQVKGESNVTRIQSQYLLAIEKIGVRVPVILDVDGEHEYKYFKALKDGVAHMKGTAKPGENGNVVIFGHSSMDIGTTGKYGEIFANLNKLRKGDEIKLLNTEDKSNLKYKVSSKKIVMPEDTYVIDQTKQSHLTLLTCWPIGSDEKRLVIFAELENN